LSGWDSGVACGRMQHHYPADSGLSGWPNIPLSVRCRILGSMVSKRDCRQSSKYKRVIAGGHQQSLFCTCWTVGNPSWILHRNPSNWKSDCWRSSNRSFALQRTRKGIAGPHEHHMAHHLGATGRHLGATWVPPNFMDSVLVFASIDANTCSCSHQWMRTRRQNPRN
jgi:hypothetical protein